jgi:hypothetical protein
MTDTTGATGAPAPAGTDGAWLRGRFALFGHTPADMTLAWASDQCDRCQSCGCGIQQEPISTADIIKNLMRNPLQAGKAMRAMMSGKASEMQAPSE